MGSVRLWATITQRVLYLLFNTCSRVSKNTRTTFSIRSTSIDFAENQLFPSSIGFSPHNHKSSPSIATDVGSVLQNVLSFFQPAHD